MKKKGKEDELAQTYQPLTPTQSHCLRKKRLDEMYIWIKQDISEMEKRFSNERAEETKMKEAYEQLIKDGGGENAKNSYNIFLKEVENREQIRTQEWNELQKSKKENEKESVKEYFGVPLGEFISSIRKQNEEKQKQQEAWQRARNEEGRIHKEEEEKKNNNMIKIMNHNGLVQEIVVMNVVPELVNLGKVDVAIKMDVLDVWVLV